MKLNRNINMVNILAMLLLLVSLGCGGPSSTFMSKIKTDHLANPEQSAVFFGSLKVDNAEFSMDISNFDLLVWNFDNSNKLPGFGEKIGDHTDKSVRSAYFSLACEHVSFSVNNCGMWKGCRGFREPFSATIKSGRYQLFGIRLWDVDFKFNEPMVLTVGQNEVIYLGNINLHILTTKPVKTEYKPVVGSGHQIIKTKNWYYRYDISNSLEKDWELFLQSNPNIYDHLGNNREIIVPTWVQ